MSSRRSWPQPNGTTKASNGNPVAWIDSDANGFIDMMYVDHNRNGKRDSVVWNSAWSDDLLESFLIDADEASGWDTWVQASRTPIRP